MAAVFEIKDWCLKSNLSEDTVTKLETAKVTDLERLSLLSPYDITSLKIELGDRGLFRKALKELREAVGGSGEDDIQKSLNEGVNQNSLDQATSAEETLLSAVSGYSGWTTGVSSCTITYF